MNWSRFAGNHSKYENINQYAIEEDEGNLKKKKANFFFLNHKSQNSVSSYK